MQGDIVDVMIVGAGPTGLTLVVALRLKGIAARIVDRQAQGANTSRAAVVHARTLEVLDTLGVTSALLERGLVVPTFRVRDRDRMLLDIDFAHLKTRYPFTLMCPQDQTEAMLRDRLRQLGGEVEWSTELRDLVQGPDHVAATVCGPGGEARVRAGRVVGCDGAQSSVRSLAGIGFAGETYAEDFVLADVTMDWPFLREEVNLFLSADGLVVVAPLPGNRFRIVATSTHAIGKPDAAFIQHVLDRRGPRAAAARVENVGWSSRFRVHHRLATTFRRQHILLCGDAAHVHSPAGGQGMNTGIQDAAALADALCEASQQDDAVLDAWASHRRAVAKAVIGLTHRMTIAATFESLPARTTRNVLLKAVGKITPLQSAIAHRIAGLDY